MGLTTNKFVKGTLTAICLLAIGIAGAQEQTQKFDFKCAAGPAKAVFADLSKAAGVDLVASSSVANDVILLQLKGVTAQEAMDQIAKTLHGEWRKEGLGWVFYRGSNYEAADQRAEIAAKVALLREQINKMVNDQKADGAFDEKAARKIVDANKDLTRRVEQGNGAVRVAGGDFAATARRAPGARAIAAMLARMSDAQLALIASGRRVVFANRPTRMQVAMPNGSQQILQNFVREQQTLQSVTRQNEGPVNENRSIVVNGFGADGMGDGDPSLGVGYAILVSQPGFGPNVPTNLNLTVADPNGKTISGGALFLGGASAQKKIDPPTIPGEKPIQLSELSKELGKHFVTQPGFGGGATRAISVRLVSGSSNGTFVSMGGGDDKTPDLSEELKNRILHPEKFEPLAFAPSEAFASVADQAGKNLVAYLPDTSFTPLMRAATTGTPLPSSFLIAAQGQGELQVVDSNGWLLVSPKAPASARARQTNRAALGVALRNLDKKGYLSLDELATFALAQPKAPANGDIDELYARLINTPFAQASILQYGFGSGWQMLQFYGSMSTGQRQSMISNGQIQLSTLSAQQIANVAEQVFNSQDGPQVEQPGDGGPQNFRMAGRGFAFGGGGSVLTERTVVLPNGIGRDGYLTIKLQNNEGVHGKTGNSVGSRFMDADSLAFDRIAIERPDMNFFGNSTHPDKFRLASQKQYAFRFVFSPQVSLQRSLDEDQPTDRPFTSYEQLPDSFRKQVEQRLQGLRQGFGRGGGGGQGAPPQ